MDISVRKIGPAIVEDRSWLGDVDGTQATRSITLAPSLFTAATHFPDGVLRSGMVLAQVTEPGPLYGLWGPYSGAANEVQEVTITGDPTGGTFTLTFNGETTDGIAYDASAADVRDALVSLPSVSSGDVVVTGEAGGPFEVTFVGAFAGLNVAQMTAGASLTGGTDPAVSVTTTKEGGSAVTDGLDVPRGFLFNTTPLKAGGPNVGAPLQERGFIRVSRLPSNSGLDAAAMRVLGNHFIFRD